MKARWRIVMALGLLASSSRTFAEPWSLEPRLGVSGDYASNAALSPIEAQAEEHYAGLFYLPLRYDGDGLAFALTPNGRISDSKGYTTSASSFYHVDSMLQVTDELGSLTAQAGWARDSSLYHIGELSNGIGVRRDSDSGAFDWTHLATERNQLELSASWVHVQYAQASRLAVLTNYRYWSGGPTYTYTLGESDSVQLLGTVGRYRSLDGVTTSDSSNVQGGYAHQIDELWKITGSVGYSHSKNTEKFFFGPFYLGSLIGNQDGTVYTLNLSRQGEQSTATLGISRALQPTGLAFLSRQDGISFSGTYTYSEHLDFALNALWQKAVNPELRGGAVDVRYFNGQLTTNWHWTPQWTIAIHLNRLAQAYGPPRLSAGSNGVSIDLVRQFLRMDL